ncbi:MAG: O-antigen ligase family protein [Selenomonadaceae bacterium]|nr:O-antigen ligase family protein [Selenomonadaceae bacterium]
MKRVNVFVRRQRIKKLEMWTMRAIIAECFFLALFPSFAAAAVLFGITAWLLRLRIDTKFRLRGLPLDVQVGLFALISAVSVFFSSARSFELIYHYFAFVGVYMLTYLLIGQNIRTREQVKKVVIALSFSALLVVLWGYFQYIFGIDTADMKWVDPEKFPELKNRVFSTLENPNVLAGYLDVFICLALGVLAKLNGRTQKLIILIAIVMLAACLTMTYSRGAYLSIVIVFIVYGIIQDWRILALFLILSVGLLLSDSSFVQRLTSIFELTDSSQGLRVGIWVSTISMIADHPFIGIGWGAFKDVYPNYDYYLKGTDVLIYHAHNIYLHYAAEIGIVGALTFFWVFFGTMLMTLELGSNEKYQAIKEGSLEIVKKVTGVDIKGRISNFKNEVKDKYHDEIQKISHIFGMEGIIADKLSSLSEKFVNWLSPDSSNKDNEDKIDEKDDLKDNVETSLNEEGVLNKEEEQSESDEKESTEAENEEVAAIETDEDIKEDVDKELPVTEDPPVDEEDNTLSETEEVKNSDTNDANTEYKKVIELFEIKENIEDDKVNISTDEKISDEKSKKIKKKGNLISFFDVNEIKAINKNQIADGIKFGIGLAFLSIALNGLTDDLLFNIPTSMLMWILVALGAAIEALPEEEVRRRNKR